MQSVVFGMVSANHTIMNHASTELSCDKLETLSENLLGEQSDAIRAEFTREKS